MINKLPKDILEYMVDTIPPFTGIFIIKTDRNGTILETFGLEKTFLGGQLKKGEQIQEKLPLVEGLIPLPQKSIQLPKIQIAKDNIADVHIFSRQYGEHWLFFMDKTTDVENIKELIQQMNEAKLQQETEKKQGQTFCFDNPFGRIDLMNVVVLLINTHHKATIVGETPEWFRTVAPQIYNNTQPTDIIKTFPFLEVFIDEAKKFMETESGKLYSSGTWIEQPAGKEEFLLKAYAIAQKGKHYLLIRLLTDDLGEEQAIIQKAREQQLLYEKLAKTERHLKQLLAYKERFFSIISHDLRSPVASVLGTTDMLINDEEFMNTLDNFNKEMIIGINDEMVHLLDYNDKLYHWSNLELGNFEIAREPISLDSLVNKSLKSLKSNLENKKIEIATELPKDLMIKVDITLFLQAVNNLISNAIKFTPKNGKITITANRGKECIHLHIQDNGLGMSKQVQETLFDESARKSTLGTYGEKGSGLGIGIVKKIVDAHCFDISVSSQEGKGTDFVLTIPFKAEAGGSC